MIYLIEFAICAAIAYTGDFITASLGFFMVAGLTYVLRARKA